MSNGARCCARCRTPYNCGNPSCACHLRRTRNHDVVTAWAAAHNEPTPSARFELDRTTANLDEG